MQVSYPLRIDGRGQSAETDEALHIRQMIEQVLFTEPGERVNRPDFGCGLQQLIFSPNSNELAAATQFLVQGALEQWLGELIQVDVVLIETNESGLNITISYTMRQTQNRQTTVFSREV